MYENKQRFQFEKEGLKQQKKITREKRSARRFKIENIYKIELVIPDSVRIKKEI